jgi:hypothetical protein
MDAPLLGSVQARSPVDLIRFVVITWSLRLVSCTCCVLVSSVHLLTCTVILLAWLAAAGHSKGAVWLAGCCDDAVVPCSTLGLTVFTSQH